MPRKTEIEQRIHIWVSEEHYAATAPAIAAIRPAAHHIFFPMEGRASIPTVTGFDYDLRFIYKLHFSLLFPFFRFSRQYSRTLHVSHFGLRALQQRRP